MRRRDIESSGRLRKLEPWLARSAACVLLIVHFAHGKGTAAGDETRSGTREPASPIEGRDANTGVEDPEVVSVRLSAGTVLEKLAKQALPMPKRPLPGQMAAPCPDGADEFEGYCWLKTQLSPDLVDRGACDDPALGFYEPSAGWCRAHRVGYRPLSSTRRHNNTVEQ